MLRVPTICYPAELFSPDQTMRSLDRNRLQSLMQREQKKFVDERPKSKALFERARKSLLAGVPMNWMVKWAGAFPPFVSEAQGAHFFDVANAKTIAPGTRPEQMCSTTSSGSITRPGVIRRSDTSALLSSSARLD